MRGRAAAVVSELLRLRNVCVEFDGRGRALSDVSLTLAAGELGAVVGGRESGKSTLLRVGAGMVKPDDGQTLLNGQDLHAFSDRERARLLGSEIAWACRAGPGAMRLRMIDYVALPLVTGHRLGSSEPQRRARAALRRLEVGDCAQLQWQELSQWQRVCVELAQAIVRRPSLVLVDDLIDGLSLRRSRDAMRLIRRLAREERCGVLIAAEDAEIGVLCDSMWLIEEGKLRELRSPPPGGESGQEGEEALVFDLVSHRRRAPGA